MECVDHGGDEWREDVVITDPSNAFLCSEKCGSGLAGVVVFETEKLG